MGTTVRGMFQRLRDAVGVLTQGAGRPRGEPAEHDTRVYHALVAARVGTWSWDIRSGEVLWSDSLEALHGLPAGGFERTFDAFLARVHPADRERVRETIDRALAEGDEYRVDFRESLTDGTVRWIEGRARVERDPDGEPVAMTGVSMDATDRKRAEEALRESEARQRFTLAAARIGTWDWDIASGELRWSPSLASIHGLEPDAFGGTFEAFLAAVHADDRDRVLGAIRGALKTGGEYHIEYREPRPDGTVGWLEGRGRVEHDDGGEPRGMSGICMDITERKRAEEHLRALAEAGTTLATSLDYETMLARVADAVVPSWGDWCAIDVLEDGKLETVAVAHVDPAKVERVREFRREYPAHIDAPSGVGYVARTGESVCYPVIEEVDMRAAIRDERPLRLQQELGLHSVVIVPLVARGRTLGALALSTAEAGRSYSEADLPHIEELGRRCAFAVDNARLYRAAERELERRRQTEDELKRLNATLEQRVAERTAVAERRAAQLRSLAGELTDAEQRERRRLARTLHDDLQQILVAAKLHLGGLRKAGDVDAPARADALARVDELLNEAVDRARTVSRELSPSVLYDAGLAAALEWLAPREQEKYGLEVHVEADSGANPEAGAEDVGIFLFQAVRELLFNIIKHADTHEAWVRMGPAEGDRVRIDVEDRGCGLDTSRIAAEADNERFGLFGMRERMALWDGEFSVRSAPNAGTQVTLVIPRSGRERVTPAG